MSVCERERESECVCERERERESVCVCVCVSLCVRVTNLDFWSTGPGWCWLCSGLFGPRTGITFSAWRSS